VSFEDKRNRSATYVSKKVGTLIIYTVGCSRASLGGPFTSFDQLKSGTETDSADLAILGPCGRSHWLWPVFLTCASVEQSAPEVDPVGGLQLQCGHGAAASMRSTVHQHGLL